MGDGFDHEPPDEDDLATLALELQTRLDRETLARAIGVDASELERIAAGYTPKPEAAQRLRLLYQMAQKSADLRDPKALLTALGVTVESDAAIPFALLPRLKRWLIAFVVLDALLFATFFVVAFVLR